MPHPHSPHTHPTHVHSGASGRNAYLDTVKAVVKRKAKLGFKFLWTSAGQQAELEKSLGMEVVCSALSTTKRALRWPS